MADSLYANIVIARHEAIRNPDVPGLLRKLAMTVERLTAMTIIDSKSHDV